MGRVFNIRAYSMYHIFGSASMFCGKTARIIHDQELFLSPPVIAIY